MTNVHAVHLLITAAPQTNADDSMHQFLRCSLSTGQLFMQMKTHKYIFQKSAKQFCNNSISHDLTEYIFKAYRMTRSMHVNCYFKQISRSLKKTFPRNYFCRIFKPTLTFPPLSCPSWPIFATKIRGLLPSFSANSSIRLITALISSSDPNSVLYAPETSLSAAWCRPNTDSIALDISPNVALNLAAFTHALSKLAPDLQASVISFSASIHASLSLSALILSSFSICDDL